MDSVLKQCSFPFDLSAGSLIDDPRIKDPGLLRKKIQQLFKNKYFDAFFKGQMDIDPDEKSISYEVRSFNKKHELESESTLIFYFKKITQKKFKLFKIVLAG